MAKIGGLAHLARALAWQARGDEFESRILHKNQPTKYVGFFIKNIEIKIQTIFKKKQNYCAKNKTI